MSREKCFGRIQEFRSCRSSGVAGVQEFRSSGVQEFRSSGVQEFRILASSRLLAESKYSSHGGRSILNSCNS
jgi:hypothetical protein